MEDTANRTELIGSEKDDGMSEEFLEDFREMGIARVVEKLNFEN